MTAKIDGTNGLLQQYDYQTPATGFSYTFAAGTQMLFMAPAATLATGTITMPASPADGMMVTFSSSRQITALTLQGNTGQSISGAVTFLPAQTAASYVYRLANTTWYPCETVPGTGSQLVNGTSQNSTSGTSIDFTGIPSWVKRITVMFNGVSTSGTSNVRVRIGPSGGVETSGYLGASGTTLAASAAAINFTAGFDFADGGASTTVRHGATSLFLLDASTNTWVINGTLGQSDTARAFYIGGVKPLAGALSIVRITTVNGTDTFDAGTINILYE